MATPKIKPIDLGSLQDAYQASKRQFAIDTKALTKAQDAFDRSKVAFQEARDALQSASRTVLS